MIAMINFENEVIRMKKEDKNEICENEERLINILKNLLRSNGVRNALDYRKDLDGGTSIFKVQECQKKEDKCEYGKVIEYLGSELFGKEIQKNINNFKDTNNYKALKELYKNNDKLSKELDEGVSKFSNSIYMFDTLDNGGKIKKEIKSVNDIKDNDGKNLKQLEKADIDNLRKIFLGEKESRWAKLKRKVLFLKKRSKQWRQIKDAISKIYKTLKDDLKASLEYAKENEAELKQ